MTTCWWPVALDPATRKSYAHHCSSVAGGAAPRTMGCTKQHCACVPGLSAVGLDSAASDLRWHFGAMLGWPLQSRRWSDAQLGLLASGHIGLSCSARA